MTEYLVYHGDKWYIAYPGAIEDDTEVCIDCDGVGTVSSKGLPLRAICPTCKGDKRINVVGARPIRLAWFERDGSMLCFDYSDPDVKELPK